LTREEFAAGSALVTSADGSMLIVERALAQSGVLREGGPVNYNEPPPRPERLASLRATSELP